MSEGDNALQTQSKDDKMKAKLDEDEPLKIISDEDGKLQVVNEPLLLNEDMRDEIQTTSTENGQVRAKVSCSGVDGQRNDVDHGEKRAELKPMDKTSEKMAEDLLDEPPKPEPSETERNSPRTEGDTMEQLLTDTILGGLGPDSKEEQEIVGSKSDHKGSQNLLLSADYPGTMKAYTKAELRKFDGTGEDGKILLALNGKVYDVSEGKRFYAPGGPYDMFAGQDATRGLATFNMKVKDEDDDLCDLQERHWINVQRWEKQFAEKYKIVGTLRKASIDASVQADIRDFSSSTLNSDAHCSDAHAAGRPKKVTYRAATVRPTDRTVLSIGRARGSLSAGSARRRTSTLCAIL